MQALASNPLQAAAIGNVVVVSVAERSNTKIMSMYKELSVKSRVRGDFHARFCERVRVKLPRSTRPMTLICPIHLQIHISFQQNALLDESHQFLQISQ